MNEIPAEDKPNKEGEGTAVHSEFSKEMPLGYQIALEAPKTTLAEELGIKEDEEIKKMSDEELDRELLRVDGILDNIKADHFIRERSGEEYKKIVEKKLFLYRNKLEERKLQNEEAIKTGEKTSEAKRNLEKAYKKDEQNIDQDIERKEPDLTPEIISEKKEFNKDSAKMDGIVGKAVEAISNMDSSQKVRDKIAEIKVSAVKKAFEKIGESLRGVESVVDLGSGWGEDLRDLINETEGENAIGIDSSTVPSREVREGVDNLKWISGDAIEKIKQFKNGCVDLSTAFAFLQVLDRDEKIELLREMGRMSEKIVIVDELKKSALNYLKKVALNKLYNAGMGKFEILEEEDWKDLFQAAGLVIKVFEKFGKDKSDFVAILEKAKKIDE